MSEETFTAAEVEQWARDHARAAARVLRNMPSTLSGELYRLAEAAPGSRSEVVAAMRKAIRDEVEKAIGRIVEADRQGDA